MLDPGFGFGKTLEHNLTLLDRLESITAEGLPVLVGMSRKSMLGKVTGRDVAGRMPASVAAATVAMMKGAAVVRARMMYRRQWMRRDWFARLDRCMATGSTTMGERQYFGTDGIRGRVGESPITPEFILKLGWAAGRAFRREGQANTMLIGKDTRLSGYMFESALEAGLSAAGMDVRLLGPMPTPAIAYLTRTFRAAAGIVISASHNPHYDNGIKFFSADGTKLDDAMERRIEQWIDRDLTVVEAADLGKAVRVDDAPGRYVEFCKSTVPTHFSLRGCTWWSIAPTVRPTMLPQCVPGARRTGNCHGRGSGWSQYQ